MGIKFQKEEKILTIVIGEVGDTLNTLYTDILWSRKSNAQDAHRVLQIQQ